MKGCWLVLVAASHELPLACAADHAYHTVLALEHRVDRIVGTEIDCIGLEFRTSSVGFRLGVAGEPWVRHE